MMMESWMEVLPPVMMTGELWMEVLPPPAMGHYGGPRGTGDWFMAPRAWTVDENKQFELALAGLDLRRPDWDTVARATCKTVCEVMDHFKDLELDVHHLQAMAGPEENTVCGNQSSQMLLTSTSPYTFVNTEKDKNGQDGQQKEISEAENGKANARKRKDMAPRSDVWNSFTKIMDGDVLRRATCNYCKRDLACEPKKNGTSSLLKHLATCKSNPNRVNDDKQPTLQSTPNQGRNNLSIVRRSAGQLKANKECKDIKSYKTKVIKNWESIATIYSKDHANGDGSKTSAKLAAVPLAEPIEVSPEFSPQRQRIGDAILCTLGDMKNDLVDAFKTTEPIPLPKDTTPAEILDALKLVPDLAEQDMLRCFGKLVLNDRLFQALMELPITMRKTWLLMLP